jgi:ATP-binding cassette, subfamily F, member 3
MSVLTVAGISLAYGGHDVLSGLSARLDAGDRAGLVGANGTGKTSLLRIIAGEERPQGGAVSLANGRRLGYVPQIPHVDPERTVREEVLSGIAHLAELEHALEQTAHELTAASGLEVERAATRYDELQRQFEAEGGYGARAEAEAVLAGLRLPERLWHQPAAGMSGGEKSRIALARTLLAKPDVLLLDEPTNHLDLGGIAWLEAFLQRWPGAVIVVSHDRTFLDAVATEIWDLRNGRITPYKGNYSAFQLQHAERTAYERDQYERQKEFVTREQALIDRYRAGQRAKWAQGRQTRLDRVQRIERPDEELAVSIKLGKAERTGRIALRLENVAIGQPGSDRVLFSFPKEELVERGERVAIVGGNGAGKTTLLRTLLGEHPPAAGKTSWGANTRPGYYRQGTEHLDDARSVIEELFATRTMPNQEARNLLARFLFRGDAVDQQVGTLSGGQRSRLALAKLTADDVNVLLLDEPTNHLDIASREALEEVLAAYNGTLLFVTHDRALITKLATKSWLILGETVHVLDGGRYELPPPSQQPARHEAERSRPSQNGSPRRELERQQKELARLEAEIASFEQQLAGIAAAIERASAAGEAVRAGEYGAAYAAAQQALSELMAAWEDAAQTVEQTAAAIEAR